MHWSYGQTLGFWRPDRVSIHENIVHQIRAWPLWRASRFIPICPWDVAQHSEWYHLCITVVTKRLISCTHAVCFHLILSTSSFQWEPPWIKTLTAKVIDKPISFCSHKNVSNSLLFTRVFISIFWLNKRNTLISFCVNNTRIKKLYVIDA